MYPKLRLVKRKTKTVYNLMNDSLNSLTNKSEMTDAISAYRELALDLASLVNKEAYTAEFKRRTKSIANDTAFLIKMESKRLASPCIRSIDLRSLVKDECRLYSHGGIDHYLNVSAILLFEKLIKRFGGYNFAVYEEVLAKAKLERNQIPFIEKPNKNELAVPDKKYLVQCQDLLNYPIRKQERLNYVVAVEVFFADNSSAHGSTLDISVDGLRIKLKDEKLLHKFNIDKHIQIVFRGLNREIGLSRESIEYYLLQIGGSDKKVHIHLKRTKARNTRFNDFVTNLVKANRRRYKVNLDNVEMSLASKIYEQAFANTSPTLGVFVCKDENGFKFAKYASMNRSNKSILDYWIDEKGNQLIGFMLNKARIYQLLKETEPKTSIVVYCFNHVKDEKVYFYSACDYELDKRDELKNTFLSYGSRKASWRVFKVFAHPIDPSEAHSPTSIPNGISKKIDKQNKPPSPRLAATIRNLTHVISVTDITSRNAQECYQQRPLEKEKIKLLSTFGHARNKPPYLLHSLRHKQEELRRQSRYILRTPVVLKTQTQTITGVTEDISVSGLKLQLDQGFTQRLSTKAEITFERLQEITENFDLTDLSYRVVHINIDKQVLHLQAIAEDEMSIAETFFSQLITNNSDKLKEINYDEPVYGLSLALRNLHSKYSPQVCTYVEKKLQGFLPAMSSSGKVKPDWLKHIYHGEQAIIADFSFLYHDIEFGKDFINKALKVLKIDPRPIKTEIFLTLSDGRTKIKRAAWQYEFTNHKSKAKFIKDSLSKSNQGFLALSVTLNKAIKPDLEKVEQELLYLSQHAIHKASYFEERMWEIAGTIFLTDITDEVLTRYNVSNKRGSLTDKRNNISDP